jgi:hypothetical protein
MRITYVKHLCGFVQRRFRIQAFGHDLLFSAVRYKPLSMKFLLVAVFMLSFPSLASADCTDVVNQIAASIESINSPTNDYPIVSSQLAFRTGPESYYSVELKDMSDAGRPVKYEIRLTEKDCQLLDLSRTVQE